MTENFWKKCNTCKKPIGFATKYFVCSVSTCNQLRTGLNFCTVQCWDAHLPFANHRQAGAIEKISPTQSEYERNSNEDGPIVKTNAAVIRRSSDGTLKSQNASPTAAQTSQSRPATSHLSTQNTPREILIVASKLKDYIFKTSGMNTSASVMEALSDHVRRLTDEAIERARADGRKTVMDRDF